MVLPQTFNTFGTFHVEKLLLSTTRIEPEEYPRGRKGSSDPFLQSTKVKDIWTPFRDGSRRSIRVGDWSWWGTRNWFRRQCYWLPLGGTLGEDCKTISQRAECSWNALSRRVDNKTKPSYTLKRLFSSITPTCSTSCRDTAEAGTVVKFGGVPPPSKRSRTSVSWEQWCQWQFMTRETRPDLKA